MGFWKVKGIQVVSGIGHLFACNSAISYPVFEYLDVFVNPLAACTSLATCDLVVSHAAVTPAGNMTLVTAVEATLRTIPRNVIIWADGAQTEHAHVTGTDQFGVAQTEQITFNGAAAVVGTKVWGAITTILQDDRSAAANIGVGLGSIVGTSRKVLGLSIDAAVYTTANGRYEGVQETTRPVRNAVAACHGFSFATALAATKTYELLYHSDEAR
jgi:hypothetical protein